MEIFVYRKGYLQKYFIYGKSVIFYFIDFLNWRYFLDIFVLYESQTCFERIIVIIKFIELNGQKLVVFNFKQLGDRIVVECSQFWVRIFLFF